MTKIVQWNCKELRARHKEVQLLMNRHQPSCLCLQEVMLENDKYRPRREYKFYATIPSGQRSKGGTAVDINKEITHKRVNIRTTISEGLPGRKGKEVNMLYIFTPNRPGDGGGNERSPGEAPSTYDPAGRFQCTQSTTGKRENEHYIKPCIEEWESAHNSSRQYEVKLSRLRIGHTRLTHGHLM